MINENEIKKYAKKLCEKYSTVNIRQIYARNEKIITELMERFDISREYAEYCFFNNNKWGDLNIKR